MSLLAALIVETSHILAEIYFIFLKNVLDQRIVCYNLKDEIFMYLFFDFCVIYLILYEEVSLGMYV